MNISIGGFSFNNLRVEGKMDVFSYIETVHTQFGLQAIDLWNAFFADTSRPLWAVADDDTIQRIAQALKEREMTLANIAVDTAHLWDPDPEVREALHQNALSHLRAAEMLGAKSVRIDAVMHGSDVMSDEALTYIAMRYREYAARAAEGGYWVGPENHTGFALNPTSIVNIAEAVSHPNFGVLLHLGRWQHTVPSYARGNRSSEDSRQFALASDAQVTPWTKHVHVDLKTLQADNAPALLSPLFQAGYEGYWAVEYNAPQDQRAAIALALQQLQSHLEAAVSAASSSTE
ncbi:sugar phosphate isomerase/epimerase [Paenibacillus sp. ACRRX]|uniref:sugar phosphate isomerase/epimerase family protein n=1 Tax=unclassified Paenibacillus TaxID=185978 RepID=UPI001EF5BDD9|nr:MULTISPECIES: TIM barrel protein [unclassified Paenibacillus]MCG7408096.1 sugar phosphate isomerase/epimerase [Paenibacillus sp. ACRRX]MDK8181521.1 TIM barrel protein [Paenibacillus sp. UMB4589-SE434]